MMYVCTLLSHSSNSEQQYEGGRQCNSKWMTDQKMQTKKIDIWTADKLMYKAGHETTPQISTETNANKQITKTIQPI